MFADTLTITIDAQAKVLVRVNEGNFSSQYRLKEATGDFQLNIRHTTYADKKNGGVSTDRHNIELVHTIYGVGSAPNTVRKSYTVMECPSRDDAVATQKEVTGFVGFFTAANIAKVFGWES